MGKQRGEIRAFQEGNCVRRDLGMVPLGDSELWISLDRAKGWCRGQTLPPCTLQTNLSKHLSRARHLKK